MNSKFDFNSISSSQASTMGDLQRLLCRGEYPPFSSAPIFESKFVQTWEEILPDIHKFNALSSLKLLLRTHFDAYQNQTLTMVNRRGEPISVHNRASCVTIGICAANPNSPMPNAMLVAHEVPMSPQESKINFWELSKQPSPMEQLALTRFFPLKFVELSVHSTDKHHLMLRLVNGRSYYLELCAPPDQQHHLFHLWLQLISLLQPSENTSNTEVVKWKGFGTRHSPNNPSENRYNLQDVPNPRIEEKEVTKQTSFNQVPLPGSVGPTEECGRKGAFRSSLKPTRQETTMQSNNVDPLDTKKSKSTEKKKPRTNTMKQKSEKKLQTSGNQESGTKSSRLLQVISRVISQ